ncbi:hypothetical protein FBU31_000295 [Coemansia sp. 'formosensis']|nr:hypothetical protein FBU31_000295 [Coemansia sp. 'formosensis']
MLDPAALEALMGSCGASALAWTKLRKTFPARKGTLGFLHFTGLLKRDIDAAKIADLPNKLGIDEAFSGAATLATYALASLLYDPRLGKIDDGPARMGLDIICMLICMLIQEHGKQCTVINRYIGKAILGYQILVNMAETNEENGSDCLTAEQHQQYIQYKSDSCLADAIGKAKPATAPQSMGFQKGGYKGKFTPNANYNKNENNGWRKKPFPTDRSHKPDQQQQQQQSK